MNYKLISKTKRSKTHGFTLIELLVVIAIIGILATFAIANYSSIRERARDTQRKSDLNNLKNSIVEASTKYNGLFFSDFREIDGLYDCQLLEVSPCPLDPLEQRLPDGHVYVYVASKDLGASAPWDSEEFSLSTQLETIKSAPTYWVVCSNGKVGESTTRPNSPNLGGVVCPLP